MLVEPAIGEKAIPGDAIFSGPRTQCLTANPGPVHTITALFFADALHRLTGIDMSTQINNMAELGVALGDEWRLCRHSCWLPRTMRPASPCWKVSGHDEVFLTFIFLLASIGSDIALP